MSPSILISGELVFSLSFLFEKPWVYSIVCILPKFDKRYMYQVHLGLPTEIWNSYFELAHCKFLWFASISQSSFLTLPSCWCCGLISFGTLHSWPATYDFLFNPKRWHLEIWIKDEYANLSWIFLDVTFPVTKYRSFPVLIWLRPSFHFRWSGSNIQFSFNSWTL